MKKISKEDILFAKSFSKRPFADFVWKLDIVYEIEGSVFLGYDFIKYPKKMHRKIESLPKELKKEIQDYLDKNGTIDDKVYYMNLKLLDLIVSKYYDVDGNLKTLNK